MSLSGVYDWFRERKRAEDRKRAQMESKRPRYPKDDSKVLLEEQAVLVHLQALAAMTEEELAAHEPPKLDVEEGDGLTLAVLDSDKKWMAADAEGRKELIKVAHEPTRAPIF
jgi:hypothetical protein